MKVFSRSLMACAMAILLFAATGCTKPPPPTPEQIKKMCYTGGEVAALTWVAADQPTADEINACKVVVGLVSLNCKGWIEGGFISALPSIDEGIAKAFPGTDERAVALRRLSHLLAVELLTQLDILFAQHPDWKQQGDLISGYVSAFCDGALEGLSGISTKRALRKAPATVPTKVSK
jgi:hypothetical protein